MPLQSEQLQIFVPCYSDLTIYIMETEGKSVGLLSSEEHCCNLTSHKYLHRCAFPESLEKISKFVLCYILSMESNSIVKMSEQCNKQPRTLNSEL